MDVIEQGATGAGATVALLISPTQTNLCITRIVSYYIDFLLANREISH